jgi:ribosome-binding protein aMBF1 (putative translation factor)
MAGNSPSNKDLNQSRVSRKSIGGRSQRTEKEEEMNRSRRSGSRRLAEEDLPENYGDLAKRVYAMSEKEGWTKEKTFELLKSPNKLIAHMENVRIHP